MDEEKRDDVRRHDRLGREVRGGLPQGREDRLVAGARILVRVPVIHGRNDGAEQDRIRTYLAAHAPERVDYLPEHRLGEGKRDALANAYASGCMDKSG